MRGRSIPAPIPPVHTTSPRPSGPPPRPDAAGRTVREERRWIPTATAALIVVVVVWGGYAVAGVLTSPAGQPHTVGDAVTIRPAAGWQLVGALGPAGEGARFTRGSGTLDIFTGSATEDPRALAQAYVEESLDPSSSRLMLTPASEWRAVPLQGGLTAVRLGYGGIFDQSGVPIEGEVTAAVGTGGIGVVFDGWGPQGQLRFVLDDVHAMVAGADFP